MFVNSKWKKLLAIGCTHGIHADKKATDAILKFKKHWKPDTVIHLGDAIDMTAFRSGAKGSSDEAEPVQPDVEAGLDFIEQLEPDVYFFGNHEDRLVNLSNHYNAIISGMSQLVLDQVYEKAKLVGAEIVNYHIETGWRKFGNWSFGHGYFFNENCPRDHAETYGNCVFAHWHRTGMAKGRRVDNPTGICVGTLTKMGADLLGYASKRRASLAWSQGFVWGEYNDKSGTMWLHEQPKNSEWRLPV